MARPGARRWSIAWLTTAAALCGVGSASAQDIVNGSFEAGPNPGSFVTINPGSTAITGWTVVSNSIDYIGTLWEHADGGRSIDLGGGIGAAGGVSQDLATEPGARYHVAFSMAGNYGGPPVVKTLRASAAGQSRDFQFDTTGASATKMGWSDRVFSFTATASTTTLTFETLDPNFGAAIDDVRMTIPPVPATGGAGLAVLAALLLAAGAAAFGLRRSSA